MKKIAVAAGLVGSAVGIGFLVRRLSNGRSPRTS
jgi:hypothetical protein